MSTLSPSLAFDLRPSATPVGDAERAALLVDPGFGRVFTDHMVTLRWSAERALTAWANSASGRPFSRSASAPSVIQTTAEQGLPSWSGRGTSVKGPPEAWTSVETPPWPCSCVTAKTSAFCP